MRASISLGVLTIGMLAAPISAVAGAVELNPGDNIQAAVARNPPHTIFFLRAGEYRMQRVVPKDQDVFIGERDQAGNRPTLNGSKLFKDSDWQQVSSQPSIWAAPVGIFGFRRGIRHGQCTGGSSVEYSITHDLPCIFPETLFFDGAFLKRTQNYGDMVMYPNTWYLDYKTKTVYLSQDPNNHKVELGVTPFAFGYDVLIPGEYKPARRQTQTPEKCNPFRLDQKDPPIAYRRYPQALCGDPLPNPYFPNGYDTYKPAGVVIENLIVEKYANPAQTGAIGYFRPGLDWQIINNEVRFNHGSGIKFKGAALVVGNSTHDNGDFGIEAGDGNRQPEFGGHLPAAGNASYNRLPEWGFWGGYAGQNAIVFANVIAGNDVVLALYEGFDMRIDPVWGAGGTKFSQTENLLVLGNTAKANFGSALWTDFSYDGTIYLRNVVRNNTGLDGGAIFHETSGGAQIVCNTVENNWFDSEGTARYSQIFISNSFHANVYNNTIRTPTDISSIELGGNGILVDDGDYRTNEELPAQSFQDRIYGNSIEFNNPGVTGVFNSMSDKKPVTSQKDVLKQLHTVTFDYDSYYVSSVADKHWQWVKDDSSAEFLTFSGFQQIPNFPQETHGHAVVSAQVPAPCPAPPGLSAALRNRHLPADIAREIERVIQK